MVNQLITPTPTGRTRDLKLEPLNASVEKFSLHEQRDTVRKKCCWWTRRSLRLGHSWQGILSVLLLFLGSRDSRGSVNSYDFAVLLYGFNSSQLSIECFEFSEHVLHHVAFLLEEDNTRRLCTVDPQGEWPSDSLGISRYDGWRCSRWTTSSSSSETDTIVTSSCTALIWTFP